MKQNVEARVSFQRISRGDGKVYVSISIPEAFRDCHVVVASRTTTGNRLPADFVRLKHDSLCVVVLPILSVVQWCTVVVLDDAGDIVARGSCYIDPNVARVVSAFNTIRGDTVTSLIRNCDQRPGENGCSIQFDYLSRARDSKLVVEGTVFLAGASLDSISGDIDISILGGNGENALKDELVVMKETSGPHPNHPECFMRQIVFSGHVADEHKCLVLWAASVDSGSFESFFVLSPKVLSYYKQKWDSISLSADRDPDYDHWYRTKHAVSPIEHALQARCGFTQRPLFSIIVPLFNTPLDYFNEMVQSVLRQSYDNFELILVNSTSDNYELTAAVNTFTKTDNRVKHVELNSNLGIAENTNAGIRVAEGSFVCFLDHDDMLTDDALYCYAKAINEYADIDLLYSDEDKYDGGRYITPFFKPDWNPDLLLGMNYICHFLCVRKSIVDSFDLPTSEYDGAQDYYMTWRVAEQARRIFHVRRVLYHWRVHPASTAGGIDAKPYALEAGRRVIESHLERCGINGRVVLPTRAPTRYEVEYVLNGNPLVSIIIPNKDCVDLLDRCIKSIMEKSTYRHFEIVVVENNSTNDDTFAFYDWLTNQFDCVRVVRFEGSFNYARICNFGIRHAKGEYLLLLNNDTAVITERWLERMLGLCMRSNTGVVGVKLLYADNTVQHAGVMVGLDGPIHINMHRENGEDGYYQNLVLRQNYSAVTGACLMTKRTVFDEVGGLDERFEVDYNDVDYCFSVNKAGYVVVLDPGVELYHYESVSRGRHITRSSILRFRREQGLLKFKWPEYYTEADPMGNPNLEQASPEVVYQHCAL